MTAQTLDPFGYWPAHRSRIRPLGGGERSDDPSYVFHTAYVDVTPGPSMAEISFSGLAAETGMIAVRVSQHLPDGKAAITERAKLTALLPSLAKLPRALKLPFDALPGARYAVTGYVYGDCDAQARDLQVSILERQSALDDPARSRSIFGRLRARRAGTMVSSTAPQLAWPVSQGYTADQAREPYFQRLAAHLGDGGSPHDRWESAYVLRVLEQYGRLERGARGLAISAKPDPVATIVREAGCEIAAVLGVPGAPISDLCAGQLTRQSGTGFDFIYTRSDMFGPEGATRALKMVADMLARLRPGGLALLLTRTGPQLDRHGLNRVALELAAQGHFVAQLRHGDADEGSVPFGIVVRTSTENLIA